jgi:tetratricopeptide (TPR) repeat protein
LVLYKQGKLREAINAAREAIRLGPELTEAQYNLGLLLLAAGQRDDALQQYQILKSLNAAGQFYQYLYHDKVIVVKKP